MYNCFPLIRIGKCYNSALCSKLFNLLFIINLNLQNNVYDLLVLDRNEIRMILRVITTLTNKKCYVILLLYMLLAIR